MQTFENLNQAISALRSYEANKPSTWPEALAEATLKASQELSPIASLVSYGEALYGYREEISQEAQELAAKLIAFGADNGLHGLGLDDRGLKIVAALRRDLGHTRTIGDWPDASEDPDALPRYTPAPEEEEPSE